MRLGRPCKTQINMKYVMIRTYSAGVFCGELAKQNKKGTVTVLKNAIRIHGWAGAASLSQLAMEGTKSPENCRFAMPVDEIKLPNCIETIPMRKAAVKNIKGVPSWKK